MLTAGCGLNEVSLQDCAARSMEHGHVVAAAAVRWAMSRCKFSTDTMFG
jgi:hypothetical protein